MTFFFQHPGFLRRTASAPPPTLPFAVGDHQGALRPFPFLHFFAQQLPGTLAIDRLRTAGLAAHLQAARGVTQGHRRRCLVNFLPAGSRTAHKSLDHVGRSYPQPRESFLDLSW